MPLKLLAKSLSHSNFPLITWNAKLKMKKNAEHPQQRFANYVLITERAIGLFFEGFMIS